MLTHFPSLPPSPGSSGRSAGIPDVSPFVSTVPSLGRGSMRNLTIWLFALALGLVFATTAVGAPKDPRVCDMYNTHGAAAHAAYCATFASSLLVWKAAGKMVGVSSPWAPDCVATTKPLQYRCFLKHGLTSGPAALVTWNATTFKPTLVIGPTALTYLADLKAELAAARAADAAGATG